MGLGYNLPGTTIEDRTKPASFNTSSSQRKPCFIGLASPYKKINYEEVTRGSGVLDSLVKTSLGIAEILKVGSQKGLNNFKLGEHFDLVDNKINWLPKVVDLESKIITDILTPYDYTSSLETPVSGEAATSGQATISTNPTPVIGAAGHMLPTGTYNLRVAVDSVVYSTLAIAAVSGGSWNNIITAINGAMSGATASISGGKILITSDTTGSSSTVAIRDGITNGLLSTVDKVGKYITTIDPAVNGISASKGYSDITFASYYVSAGVVSGLSTGTYNIGLNIDGGGSNDVSISVTAGDLWSEVVASISALTDISAEIVNGAIRIYSDTIGSASSIVITEGTTDGFLEALNMATSDVPTVVAGLSGVSATYGYTDITTGPTQIVGGVPSRIAAGTYTISLNVNGGGAVTYSVTFTGTETWSQVVTAINSAVSIVASASISSGKLRFQSKITGINSTVSVVDGNIGGLLSAFDMIEGTTVSTIDIPSPGKEAISGYAIITSSPEDFSANKMCNLPSGVYTIGVSIDGAASSDVNITVTGPTQLWSSVIDSMGITGATVTLENGSIKVVSNSVGIASSVTIVDGSVNPFLHQLDTLTGTSVTVKVGSLSYPRALSTVNITFTENGETFTMTLASPILEGDTEVILEGDATAVEAIQRGTVLFFSTVGTWLSQDAKYFVSYTYNRPELEFGLYKEFHDFADVVADLGDDIPSNDLVMISKLALNAYGNPTIGVVQIKAKTKTNFLEALNDDIRGIKYKNVQTVCCLTTDKDVRSYLINHINERSLPESGRWRVAYTGASAGTPVGDESIPNSLRGITVAIKNERVQFINATRGLYFYNDPNTGDELSTVVDGGFISAAIAAYRDSFPSPVTTLLGKTISGITLFEEDVNDYYSDYHLKNAGSSSVFLVAPSAAGGMVVIDDLTTDNATVEKNNINIITAKDYIATDVVIQMNRVFRGNLIYDEADYVKNVNTFLSKLFNEYKRNRILAKVGYTTASRHETKKDTILISYGFNAVYTHKYTEGTFEIIV